MKRMKKKGIIFSAVLVVALAFLIKGLMFNVKADPVTIEVDPGAGTLKKAVESAADGTIIKLRAGSYTASKDESGYLINNEPVYVKSSITIEGVGILDHLSSSKDRIYTTVSVPLVIAPEVGSDGHNKTVTLKNFSSSNQSVPNDFIFVKVEKPVNLNIENVENWGILRDLNVVGAGSLLLDEGSSGSVVSLDKAVLDRFGTSYGVKIKASNIKLTANNNSVISGRGAIVLDDGDSNTIDISNTRISGRDIYKDNANVIEVNKQSNTTINITNSSISGAKPKGDINSNVISFGNGNVNKVSVNLKNTDITEGNNQAKSTIFNFGSSKENDGNVVTMDKDCSITFEEGELEFSNKYNVSDNYAVVGLYDKDGNSEIKVYDNGSTITELDTKASLEGYKFKGWFKQYDGKEYIEEYQKTEAGYPKVVSGQNMDLYPNFVKTVTVTIGTNGPHVIEEGQTLEAIENVDAELETLKKPGTEIKGYIMHGVTGGQMSYTATTVEQLKKYPITEDVTIEAVHSVKLYVNDESFTLDVGQTISNLSKEDQTRFEEAKLNKRTEKEFSRLVYESDGETFNEDSPINEEVKLITKHYAIVSVGTDEYRVEEGAKVSTGKKYPTEDVNLADALKDIKDDDVEYKSFSKFVDSDNKTVIIEGEDESTIEKTTTITPVYTIEVKIADKSYTIDENGKLTDLTTKEDEITKALEKLVEDAGEKNFSGFWISVTDAADKTFVEATSENYSEVIKNIMGRTLNKNTTIYAEYNAIVTIVCPDGNQTFAIDTGKTLQDVASKYPEQFEKAKYQEYSQTAGKEERFSRFVVGSSDEEFKETDEIVKSITLTPKYFAFVKIDDDREEVGGTYKVEKGKTVNELQDYNGKKAQEALAILRSNITSPDVVEGEELHFDKLVTGDNKDVEKYINSDITIKGLYHYDVTVVEDYDDPHNSELGSSHHEGLKGFIVYKNHTLGEDDEQVEEALDKLVESVNAVDTRKFSAFMETNTGITYDKQSLLAKKFNYHININALVAYKVKVGNAEDWVVEGHAINDSEKGLLMDELNKLMHPDNKEFATFVKNGKEVSNIPFDTVIDEYTEISAKYNVVITIGSNTYTLKEGGKLADLSADEQIKVKADLAALETDIEEEGYNFKGYNVGNDIDAVMQHSFDQNTEITPSYNVRITIGENNFYLEDDKTLETLKGMDNFDNATSKANRKLLGFMAGKERIDITNNSYTFDKNTTLMPIYGIEVTVKNNDGYSKKYTLEEGQTLNDVIGDSITDLNNLTNGKKKLAGFIDEDKQSVDLTKPLSSEYPHDAMVITAVYEITVVINDYQGNKITEVTIKDTETLDSKQDQWLTEVKNREQGVKSYAGLYLDDVKVDTNQTIEENVTVVAKYNVVVTIKDTNNAEKGKFTIFEGQTLNDVSKADKDKLDALLRDDDLVLNSIDLNQVFTENTDITAKYYKTVTIGKETFKIEEGKSVQELIDAGKLDSVMNVVGKHFEKFVKDGEKYDPTTIINENITLEAIYKIIITVKTGKNTEDYEFILEGSLANGVGLSDIESKVNTSADENFLRFETEDQEKITGDTAKFTTDTTIVKIYTIKVATDDNETGYQLESGQTLEDFKTKYPEAYRNLTSNIDGRNFSRFVDINGKTIMEKDPIYADVKIIPKFNIKITVFRRDDDGNEVEDDTVTFELGEELTLSQISNKENQKLQKWIDDVIKELLEEGKDNYALVKYVDEDGEDIDLSETIFKEDSKIEAIFAYKKEETPVDPSDPDYPLKEKAPNTGIKNNETGLGGTIIALMTTLGLILVNSKKSIFNRH